jgi:hypothetical protein
MLPILPKRIIILYLTFIALIWGFLFKDFLTGIIIPNIDSFSTYGSYKYFFNNLFNGVIALWEPYVYLGRAHIHLAITGTLNIIVLPIYLLHFINVNYYHIYLTYVTTYLLFGIYGFYILNKIILKNNNYALLATCFLMFSGLPAMIFNQIFILLLFVPTLWFFIFLLEFFTTFKEYAFWGIICALMMLIVSYYPFYFICLIFSFLIFYFIIFPRRFLKNLNKLFCFLKFNQTLAILGTLFILIAFIPIFLFKITNDTNELLSPARHACSIIEQCQNRAEMQFEEVAFDGSFGERFSGGRLFSHLDKFNYNDDSFIYVSSFAFIILFLAMFTVMDRKRLVIFSTYCTIFLISLGGATPLYKILFDHVFIFKYFRNLFFYSAFLIPLFILFTVAQLKSTIEQLASTKQRTAFLIFIVVSHILIFLFLQVQGNIIPATYVTVFLSLLFFILFSLRFFTKKPHLLLLFLTILIVIEPIYVFIYYRNNTPASVYQLPQNHKKAQFDYLRPDHDIPTPFGDSLYSMFVHLGDFQDSSGKVNFQPDFLNSYVFDFYNTPFSQKDEYIKNKIMIYNSAPSGNMEEEPPLKIIQNIKEFKILHFDVNSLKFQTHFSSEKFLIYHDAYSTFWKAFINGKETKITRAHDAFKGIHLPAGENIVQFRYQPPGGQGIYVFVLITMTIAFCILGFLYWQPIARRN